MKLSVAAVVLTLAALSMTGCSDPEDPCKVNPTYQAEDGRWLEADGEPLDNDPCDAEADGGHKKPKPKPKPKNTKK